ncbi:MULTISPECIES: CoA pyrophosphatase [unclassified Microbacterium]|uniref:NUDIX hydrolase n=1 Tax=unclassified Microbacterium TaxID=2609290 RepID=UPI000EA8CDFE|nr:MULTISPECIES: CoA pyrophosphatase [unclassified Microbacterium]MBT2484466.1 CoA pyrophosphatase [Microbacterium sp. ISL-108]RKN67372.1 CoA pyrophosphatase [Microbacterium sp. CGR2]
MSLDPDTLQGARAELLAAAQRDAGWMPSLPPIAGITHSAAVLILFGRLDSIPTDSDGLTVAADLDVLLQRRAPTLSSHPGQVSFPGGRTEPSDADAVATALREAEEETGLDPAGVEILATLPKIPLAASNHLVTPVLAWWRSPSSVVAVDHAETVEVFRVPVAQLLDPQTRFTSTLHRLGQTFRGPAFDVDGTIVWGFTAMVLDALFDAAGWTVPWDAEVERPIEL